MIHTTYRRLDEAPTLCGFTFLQWGGLLVLGGAMYGIESLLALPTQPAITVFAFTVGLPACLMYFSESGRPSLSRLMRDALRWLFSAKKSPAGVGSSHPLHVAVPAAKPERAPKTKRLGRAPHRLLLTTPNSKDGTE